jgi:CHAT domain-containing protein
LSYADQIQDGEEKSLANILSFTSERQRLLFERRSFSDASYHLWATVGAARPLASAVVRTKGIVLDSLLEDRLVAEASTNSQVRQLSTQLAKVKQRLGRLGPDILEEVSNSGFRPLNTNEIETVSCQVESLEASLARRVTALGGARRALATRVEAVQAAIPKESALLEMVRYRHYARGESQDNYGALILFKEGEPIWVRLGRAAPIDKNIKLYQHLVRNPGEEQALAMLLRELCDQVWQPIQLALPKDITQVIISPDSELNFLSFATLLTPDGRFVGEKFDIGYVSTARDLLADPASVAGTASLAVWANPDFGASVRPASTSGELVASRAASTRELRDLRLRPLPGREKEGRLLSEMASEFGFREVVLHLGPGATEAELRRVHSPRVLHLATHGFVLPEVSDEPSAPAPDAELLFPRLSQVANNPMLRSGLALAGAQRTIQAWARGETVPGDNDGIVTAEEIGTLDFKNTWLVVLSACDTGLGEARSGEGVLGLRRGFIQAGAKNLLMTLWPIDDERTADLIADFYLADKKHGNAAKALSVTQRKWLAKLRTEKGVAEACRIAGPFILSFQGRPNSR